MDLLSHLLDVIAEQRPQHLEVLVAAPQFVVEPVDPGEPVGLDQVALTEMLLRKDLVGEIAVAIGDGVLDSDRIQLVGPCLDLGDLLRVKKTSDDRVPVGAELRKCSINL